jgi:hypothetical protein
VNHWLVCDGVTGDRGFCLYSERGASRLRSDPPRCVKHGAILEWAAHCTIGKSREEARRLLTQTEEDR